MHSHKKNKHDFIIYSIILFILYYQHPLTSKIEISSCFVSEVSLAITSSFPTHLQPLLRSSCVPFRKRTLVAPHSQAPERQAATTFFGWTRENKPDNSWFSSIGIYGKTHVFSLCVVSIGVFVIEKNRNTKRLSPVASIKVTSDKFSKSVGSSRTWPREKTKRLDSKRCASEMLKCLVNHVVQLCLVDVLISRTRLRVSTCDIYICIVSPNSLHDLKKKPNVQKHTRLFKETT